MKQDLTQLSKGDHIVTDTRTYVVDTPLTDTAALVRGKRGGLYGLYYQGGEWRVGQVRTKRLWEISTTITVVKG